MSKDKKKSKRKHKHDTALSDFLTPAQKAKYRAMGEPDLTQNWLEIFTDDIISDLFTIMRSCSDNQLKSDYIHEELAPYGFEDVGLGTNIFTMSHPNYPGVVFKIALDNFGIADNFNDCILQNIVPHYVKVFARHPSAIVSVQQRGVLPTPDQMSIFYPKIIKLLKTLSEYFLVVDLSPKMFLNYVVDRNGDFLICDGSDLYPKHQIKNKIRCNNIVGQHRKTGEMKYCEGKLHYKEDFSALVCEKCGKEYNPLWFRPKKEIDTMWKYVMDGISAEERERMEQEEMNAIRSRERRASEPEHEPDEPSSESEELEMATPEELIFEPSTDEGPEEPEYEEEETEDEDEVDMSQISEVESDEDDDEDDEVDLVVPAELIRAHGTSDTDIVLGTESAETADHRDDEEEEEEVVKLSPVEPSCVADGYRTDRSEEHPVTAYAAKAGLSQFTKDDLQRILDENPEELIAFIQTLRELPINDLLDEYDDSEYFSQESDDSGQSEQLQIEPEDTDNSIPDSDDGEESPIVYRVINAGRNDQSLPGIYLDVNGDFRENFDELGLPLFVSIDHGTTYTCAIRTGEMMRMIRPIVDELLEEEEEYQRQLHAVAEESTNGDDSDEEEDEEDGSDDLITHEDTVSYQSSDDDGSSSSLERSLQRRRREPDIDLERQSHTISR